MKDLLRNCKHKITELFHISHRENFALIRERIDARNDTFYDDIMTVLDSILDNKRNRQGAMDPPDGHKTCLRHSRSHNLN